MQIVKVLVLLSSFQGFIGRGVQKIDFEISCKLSSKETIFIKCQILFSWKNKKKIFQNVVCWNVYPACKLLKFLFLCLHFRVSSKCFCRNLHQQICSEWNILTLTSKFSRWKKLTFSYISQKTEFSWENKKYFKMSSAEFFTQHAKF